MPNRLATTVAAVACAVLCAFPLAAQERRDTINQRTETTDQRRDMVDPQRETVDTRMQEVPNVVGLPELAAQLLVASRHLNARSGGQENSSQRRGSVLRTEPRAGTRVARGSTVVYWVSSGRMEVPDLIGRSTSDAGQLLARAGFTLGTVTERTMRGAAGRILEQDPRPRTLAAAGSSVAVTVVSSQTVVPDVVGNLEANAVAALQRPMLTPRRGGVEASAQARGIVLRTQPAAGNRVQLDSVVSYWLASGENRVPDVRGQSREVAGRTLADAGFSLGTARERADLGTPGRVLEQAPAPGSLAALGSAVGVVVGRELRVPDVVGRAEDNAAATLRGAGLVPARAGEEDSLERRGIVRRTQPGAGTRVVDGDHIEYRIASGRNRVPDVVGMPLAAAETALARAGFTAGTLTSRPDPGIQGRVLAQSPTAQAGAAELGSGVDLVVSAEYPLVPDVIGIAEPDAVARLEGDGFVPRRGERAPSVRPAGEVDSTSPAAGSQAPPGSEVAYRLASGENLVPDVVGQSPQEAVETLETGGFRIGETGRRYTPGGPDSVSVVEQSPVKDTLAPLGSAIAITLNSPVPLVPDVVGQPLDEARRMLQEAGLSAAAPEYKYDFGDSDIVLAQQPGKDDEAAPGAAVALQVSKSIVPVAAGAAALMLALFGAWWTQLRPWPAPVSASVHVGARLEPIAPVDPQSIDLVKPKGPDFDVSVSVRVDTGTGEEERSIAIDREEVDHGGN